MNEELIEVWSFFIQKKKAMKTWELKDVLIGSLKEKEELRAIIMREFIRMGLLHSSLKIKLSI